MDKMGDDKGIVAFVTNNGFIDGQMFDGMRKHLSVDEFDTLYILDLGGNTSARDSRGMLTCSAFRLG